MKSRRKKSKRASGLISFINGLSSLSLVVIAVILVIFVFFYIRNNSFFDPLPFSKAYRNQDQEKGIEVIESDSSSASGYGDSVGLVSLDNGRLAYYLSENEIKAAEASGSDLTYAADKNGGFRLTDSWKIINDSVYYFDKDGYSVDTLSEGAMEFSFDDDNSLSKIHYNDSYRSMSDSEENYPGLAASKTLWAFVDNNSLSGDVFAVRFKKTAESSSYELGGGYSPQYSSKYALSVSDSFIYYAIIDEDPDKSFSELAGKLFRMKPGNDKRELCGENVKGYKILKDASGQDVVIYYDGRSIHISDSFVEDESMIIFSQDAEYTVDISSDRPVLMLEGLYPVAVGTREFKTGDFSYSLSKEGIIMSVAPRHSVVIDDFIYYVNTYESQGVQRSRIVRRDRSGAEEVISSEFAGSVNNIHAAPDRKRIIGEYSSLQDTSGIISVTTDGDVDYLIDSEALGRDCILYSVASDHAIAGSSSDGRALKKIRLSAGYPLAVAVEPVALGEEESSEDAPQQVPELPSSDIIIGGPQTPGVDGGASVSQSGPGSSSVTSDRPGGQENDYTVSGPSQGQVNNAAGTGGTVEKKGPGDF